MNDLIFDIGFYNGADTRNYLDKVYRVVAIEADPDLYNIGIEKFAKEISDRRLILLNRVFGYFNDSVSQFYIHPNHKDWSTAHKGKAEYWGIEYETEVIETINYDALIGKYGIPHYIKCDIEGFDDTLARQIANSNYESSSITSNKKPDYISYELSRLDYFHIFSWLYVAGYSQFQLRNQLNNPEYSSGDFAEYLPADEWMNFDETLTRYMKYKELKAIDNKNLALGWIDIHARK